MADDPTTPDAASDQADVELRNIIGYVEQVAEIRVRNGPYDDGFIAGMLGVREVIQARLTIRQADPDPGQEVWLALDSLLEWWRHEPGYALIFRETYPELAIRMQRLNLARLAPTDGAGPSGPFDDPRYRDAWNAGYRQGLRDQNGDEHG